MPSATACTLTEAVVGWTSTYHADTPDAVVTLAAVQLEQSATTTATTAANKTILKLGLT